jgi:hypothetical protein
MRDVFGAPILSPEAVRPRLSRINGDTRMEPTQTRIFLMMMLVTLLFAAQLMTQTGAFAALP